MKLQSELQSEKQETQKWKQKYHEIQNQLQQQQTQQVFIHFLPSFNTSLFPFFPFPLFPLLISLKKEFTRRIRKGVQRIRSNYGQRKDRNGEKFAAKASRIRTLEAKIPRNHFPKQRKSNERATNQIRSARIHHPIRPRKTPMGKPNQRPRKPKTTAIRTKLQPPKHATTMERLLPTTPIPNRPKPQVNSLFSLIFH